MKRLNLNLIYSFVLIALLVNLPALVGAQKPSGFLGKRQVFELDVAISPLGILTSNQQPGDLKSGIGLGATYRYVISHRTSLGLSLMYHNFGTPVVSDVEQGHPSTEFAALVEFQVGGSARFRSPAPLGSMISYGVGVVQYSGVARTDVGLTTRDPEEKLTALMPMVRLGYQYRYIVKDRFSITPWSRLDGTANSLNLNPALDERESLMEQPILPDPIVLLWRAGVSFGVLF